MIRPRRSMLFMPGSNPRALEKARTLPADGLILDLEDAVAPDAKAGARDQIAQAVTARGFGKREVLIRVNSLDSPWWLDDLNMAAKVRPDGILVPKISSVADLKVIADRLRDIGADSAIRVWAMIETAQAILHAEELSAQVHDPAMRLAGFVFGPNDIARETRIRMVPGRSTMLPMILHCVLAAHAHGLDMLDGPYGDIGNMPGSIQVTSKFATRRSRRLPPMSPTRAKYSRLSNCLRTPRAEPFSLTAEWSSGCMPRSRSGRLRLPTLSQRQGTRPRDALPWPSLRS